MEYWQLQQRQSLLLEVKVKMTKRRIQDWIEHWDGRVYVSFSGGIDSTVLLYIARQVDKDIPAVFIDTGVEFPEIRDFVKNTDNVIWLKPRLKFHEVINKYGYPVISKEQSAYIDEYRNTKSDKLRDIRWNGNKYNQGKISIKWRYLIDSPFKISDKCCDILKKEPVKHYEKVSGNHPLLGNLAEESDKRTQDYIRYGCNAFRTKRPISRPLSFWLADDIRKYIALNRIPYSTIYNMGYQRTGCMFCLFGLHTPGNSNKLILLQKTHPKIYNFAVDYLGYKQVLEWYPSRVNNGERSERCGS